MYKRTFKYTDYDGNAREEDVYFNLNESEIAEMTLSVNGGLDQMIRRMIAAQDTKEIVSIFKDIVLKAYGEKSLDGKRFVKSKELSEAFAQTEMYNQLFMEIAFDAQKCAEFMNAITPKKKGDGGKIMDFKGGATILPGETPQDAIRRLQGEVVVEGEPQ